MYHEYLISTAFLAHDYRSNNPSRDISTQVPLVFLYARSSDGNFGLSDLSDESDVQTWISNSINVANESFGGEILLFQLGDVVYIDHDEIHTMFNALVGYVYLTNAIIVSIVPGRGTSGSVGSFPIHNGIFPNPPPNEPDNMITMGPIFFNPSNRPEEFTHELGHVYNLLHTFQVYSTMSGKIIELVIREVDNSKSNPNPNWAVAGDLVKDTDADCRINDPDFPDCYYSADYCTITDNIKFNSTYSGNYQDPNDDYLINHNLRQRNIMSYFTCRDLLTGGQLDRVAQTNNDYRKDQLNASGYDLVDFIEFEGTAKKLKNILTIINFPIIGSFSNMRTATHRYTTNQSGKIETILLDSMVRANVIYGSNKINKGTAVPFNWTFSGYSYSDWTDSLDIFDVIAIQKFIGWPTFQYSQNTLPTGYKKLSADVNDDGVIDEHDFKLIQQLLNGSVNSFANYSQPWRFVPEFIPQGSYGFHSSPFNLTIDGTFVPKADYAKQDYEFIIANGHNGKSGFDGIKLGNTGHTPLATDVASTYLENLTSDLIIHSDTTYKVALKVNAVGHSGLQFGMKVTNGTIVGNSLNFNSSMPYIDTISFRLDSASSKLNLVWTDLLNLYDSLILCEFLFTPSVSSSSLDSFFIVDESLIPAYIVDSSGSPVDGNFVVSIIGEDTSVLRHSFDSIIDSVFKLNVYPNPSNEVIFISLEGNYESTCINKLATISIISSDGIVVKEDRILINESHEVHEMDVSVLSGGQWFVLVTMDSHTVVGSFIIIR